MGKLDEMRRGASLGGRPGSFPPGMDPTQAVARPARLEGVRGDRSAARIAIDRIVPDPDQPRAEFDDEALERLAASLKAKGQLQPIRVRWDEGRGVYVVLVGERRWRAAQRAGLAELTCTVHDGDLSSEDRLGLQLVENALREDLRPIEQARAYKRLMDAHGWTMTQLAEELAIHQTSVSRALSLLELPEAVQDRVEAGSIAPSAAYELSKLDRPEQQEALADVAAAEQLSRAEVAEAVRAVKARRPAAAPKPEPWSVDLGDGCTVQVRWRKPGGPDLAQALRRALKLAQEQRKTDEAA